MNEDLKWVILTIISVTAAIFSILTYAIEDLTMRTIYLEQRWKHIQKFFPK
jgi:hypothetical protein